MASDPLTIVHVVRQFYPAIGGMEEFVEQLAARQVAAGHSVRVITLNRIFDAPDKAPLPERSMHRGIEIVRLVFMGSKRYPLAPGVLRHLRGCDLVHVHGVDFFCDLLAATSLAHRKPLFLSTHGGFFHTRFANKLKQVYFRSITRLSLSRYRRVIACSDQDYARFSPIAASRTILIRNPVDVQKFASRNAKTEKTVIYFGRFDENKQVGRLIEWFSLLRGLHNDWRLILAGRPGSLDKPALEQRVNAVGMTDCVEIFESPDRAELARLVERASVYGSASEYEGFGLAAVEAASAGLYPVLSNIPPYASLVEALGFGQIVDFSRPEQWPASITQLLDGLDKFRAEFDERAIAQAVAPYSWDASTDSFEKAYRTALGIHDRLVGTVRLNVLVRGSAIEQIKRAVDQRIPVPVYFCNAHTVNLAAQNLPLREALSEGVVLNDGIGVDLASKLLFGKPFPSNLNGTDFVPEFLQRHAQDLSVFLVGGEPGVAKAAAAAWQQSFPGLKIAGAEDGFFADMESKALVHRARESGANMLLVGMGQPRQELWATLHWPDFPGPTICVGALFDFASQRVPRAPAALRRLRLEWAYRLWIEPRRLARRYALGNIAFVARVIRQRLTGVR